MNSVQMKFNVEEINQLIATRRSVFPKNYTGERVSDKIVKQILMNANWAPNHKMTEPWRFVVFTGKGKKKLGEFQSKCYKKVTTARGIFDKGKFHSLLKKPMESSHIISVGMKRDGKKSI